MTHTTTLFHRQDRCIECNTAFAPQAERFLINDRHWCATCAAPYRTTFAGSMARDVGMFVVAAVCGIVAFVVVAMMPFGKLAVFAGGATFAGIFLTWFMRPKVYVERILPRTVR
jgi:hypothetical protein